MNIFNIARSFEQMKTRNWNTLYWCVDLHDTVIEGKYNLHNVGANLYPGAAEVLTYISKRHDQRLILWTSSHDVAIQEMLKKLSQEHHIFFDYINDNPECPNTDLCDFSQKFYFNILLDDKAGFDGHTDWFKIKEELIRIGQWS